MEIGFALVSAAFLAVIVFAVVAGPGWLFDLSAGARHGLVTVAAVLAPMTFVVRVVTVLWRFQNATRYQSEEPDPQPSQPGRTNPDS